MTKTKVEKTESEPKFSKESLLNAKRYRPFRDILTTKLKDGAFYTMEQTDKIVNDFLNKEVK